MTLLAAWVAVPLLLAALAAPCGALAARVSGLRLPGALLVPVGLCVMVLVAGLLTVADATAEFAAPAVLGLAAAGLLMTGRREWSRPIAWRAMCPPAAAALAAFLAYGAPVLASGEATFAGYVKLDDTANWLAQTHHVMERGRSLEGLAPSSYEAALEAYVGNGYPLGAILPLGVAATLSGMDAAWLFQPYLAFLAAVLALALWSLLGGLVRDRWLRALAAAIGAQPALLFGYALWGGVKELFAAAMLATLAALVAITVPALGSRASPRLRWRALGCVSLPCAAMLTALSFGGLAWIGPALLAAIPAAVGQLGHARALRAGLAGAALVVILAAPSFASINAFFAPSTVILTSAAELGNLNAPLNPLQILGVWLAGDFRFAPADRAPTYVLIAVVALAAAAGIVLAVRRNARGLTIYAAVAGVGAAGLSAVGSPWSEGKALATASPAFVLAAMAAACVLFERARRVEGAILGLVVAGGVLTSNALAYREAWLAPRDSLVELESIGERIAGQGPTLMNSADPFAARHILRRGDPEEASGLRRRIVPLRDGSILPKGGAADIDRFRLTELLTYRTLVLRRSPLASRPPSMYQLVWRERHWEVWQRPEPLRVTILEHVPLGRGSQPAGIAPCSLARRLAEVAGEGGSLAAASRPEAIVVPVEGQDDVTTTVVVPAAGKWTAWLGGSFKPRAQVYVAGRPIGALRHRTDHTGSIWPLGSTTLPAGPVRVSLRFDSDDWRPGSGGASLPAGPLVLGRAASNSVTVVPAREWRRLCGRRLDWIEALASP